MGGHLKSRRALEKVEALLEKWEGIWKSGRGCEKWEGNGKSGRAFRIVGVL